eukprot:1484984-Prymnesium_polylepis.1
MNFSPKIPISPFSLDPDAIRGAMTCTRSEIEPEKVECLKIVKMERADGAPRSDHILRLQTLRILKTPQICRRPKS